MNYIAIVAPEPVFWLEAVVDAVAQIAPVTLLCPWRLPNFVANFVANFVTNSMATSATGMARVMPASLAGFVARRSVPETAEYVGLPGWTFGEGLLRAWVRGRTDRDMTARFAVRRAVDIWAARWLRRIRRRPRAILAPSLAARTTLATANQLGVAGFLLEDMPDIRGLHRDLDRALARHPECSFLARYRAPGSLLARQEVERVLADGVAVRGYHARRQRQAAGMPGRAVSDLPRARQQIPARSTSGPGGGPIRVLLAGLAAARHGTVEALAAIAARPDIELVVRPGEGLEPRDLLTRPQVRPATAEELATLRGIHAVIAPALCESYPRALEMARERGLPTVATRRAAGFSTPTRIVAPGDIDDLRQALDDITAESRQGPGTSWRPAPLSAVPDGTDGARPLTARLAEVLSSPA